MQSFNTQTDIKKKRKGNALCTQNFGHPVTSQRISEICLPAFCSEVGNTDFPIKCNINIAVVPRRAVVIGKEDR